MEPVWTKVDDYFAQALSPADPVMEAALAANARAGLPPIDVSPLQGKLLNLLVTISGAKRVLEVGTLGGYSTLWLARAVGPDGRIVTLEINPAHAAVARSNLEAAGVLDRVDIRVGPAIETLPSLDGNAPFDFVFIDADKPSNPDYLAWALRLSRPGTVIVIDNVVREGRVVDAQSADASVQGVRRLTAMMAAEPRLTATAIQTVGAKGYDGFAIALVRA
jgi:predicted O-methyltransferase YrrM